MRSSIRRRISLVTFGFLSLVVILVRLPLRPSGVGELMNTLNWDVFGYYLYLPAAFIHHDLGLKDFAWVQRVLDTYDPTVAFYQALPGPAGNYVMKYPLGLAVAFSPFFFLAQALARLFGFPPDGFSLPYQVSIAVGGLLWTVGGLWFLRKVLLRFFTDGVAALTMLLLVLGTNYYSLTAYGNAMPHNYLFTLFAVVVWLTIRWHEQPRWRYALPLGVLCGWAALIRPTDIVIVLVPLLWNVRGWAEWREKVALARRHWGQALGMLTAVPVTAGLQAVYWKIYAGSWLYYSYKDERLQWLARHLLDVVFSYRKGWLVYTPLMVLALAGFWPLARKSRALFVIVLSYFTVHLLIVASWQTWWYGGCFGQRAMVEAYVLLAFPLAALLERLAREGRTVRALAGVGLSLLVLLNLLQTWQYVHGVLDSHRMSRRYYWAIFGRTRVSAADQLYLEPTTDNTEREYLPDPGQYIARRLARYDFETPGQADPAHLCSDAAHSGHGSLRMDRGFEFSPGVTLPYREVSRADLVWIRASAWVWFSGRAEELATGLVITCNRRGKAFKYRILDLGKQSLAPGTWNEVTMDYRTPYFEDKNETLQVYFWHRGDKELLIDDFEITLFEPPLRGAGQP